jgi:hypothetical protein
MKKTRSLSGLFYNMLIAIIFASVTGFSAVAVFVVMFCMTLAPQVPGVLSMAIQKEIWIKDIVEGLYRDNGFLQFAFNADEYVLAGKVVHIPQAGAAPSVSKNRSSLPATIAKRTDTDLTFSLDEYTTDPVLIPDADTVELSYDKRNSVLSQSKAAISETVAENILLAWAPTTAVQQIRTSGSLVTSHMPDSTTTRKKFGLADLKAAAKLMDKQSIPVADRACIMSADMYDQFTDDLTATQYKDFSASYNAATGVMGDMFGFKVFKRGFVVAYDNEAVPAPKAYAAAGAATDNDAVICWQKSCVVRALGTVDFFERIGDPAYYGDIYSSLLRGAGAKMRTDKKGVVAIVQTP